MRARSITKRHTVLVTHQAVPAVTSPRAALERLVDQRPRVLLVLEQPHERTDTLLQPPLRILTLDLSVERRTIRHDRTRRRIVRQTIVEPDLLDHVDEPSGAQRTHVPHPARRIHRNVRREPVHPLLSRDRTPAARVQAHRPIRQERHHVRTVQHHPHLRRVQHLTVRMHEPPVRVVTELLTLEQPPVTGVLEHRDRFPVHVRHRSSPLRPRRATSRRCRPGNPSCQ